MLMAVGVRRDELGGRLEASLAITWSQHLLPFVWSLFMDSLEIMFFFLNFAPTLVMDFTAFLAMSFFFLASTVAGNECIRHP